MHEMRTKGMNSTLGYTAKWYNISSNTNTYKYIVCECVRISIRYMFYFMLLNFQELLILSQFHCFRMLKCFHFEIYFHWWFEASTITHRWAVDSGWLFDHMYSCVFYQMGISIQWISIHTQYIKLFSSIPIIWLVMGMCDVRIMK